VAEIDFEAEGLLEGVSGTRDARLALLPVERVFEPGAERYSARDIAELTGLRLHIRVMRAVAAAAAFVVGPFFCIEFAPQWEISVT
jgi:hypothetical protein